MQQDNRSNGAEGLAALGICESLLLALTDLKVITRQDARDLLTDVATAPQAGHAVTAIVQRLLDDDRGDKAL